jgi:hypothetical protein
MIRLDYHLDADGSVWRGQSACPIHDYENGSLLFGFRSKIDAESIEERWHPLADEILRAAVRERLDQPVKTFELWAARELAAILSACPGMRGGSLVAEMICRRSPACPAVIPFAYEVEEAEITLSSIDAERAVRWTYDRDAGAFEMASVVNPALPWSSHQAALADGAKSDELEYYATHFGQMPDAVLTAWSSAGA